MKIFIIILFWFLFFNHSWATKDPVALFVKDFIKQTDNSSELYNYWYGTTNFNPDGGYIFRFDYDVTADGRKEAFIASSTFAFFREGENWNIYSPSESGDYQLIARNLTFHPEVIAITQLNREEILLRFTKFDRDSGYSLISYRFFSDGSFINESRLLTEEEGAQIDKEAMDDEFKMEESLLARPYIQANVQKIVMTDYIREKEPKWKKISDHAYEQQYLDPRDRESLENAYAVRLSPSEALQAIIPKLDPKEIRRTRRVANWKLRKGKELTEFESAVMGPDPRKGKSPQGFVKQVSQKVVESEKDQASIFKKKWFYFAGGMIVLLVIYLIWRGKNKL